METNHITAGAIVVLLRDRQPALLTRTIGESFEAPSGCIMCRVEGADGDWSVHRVRPVQIHESTRLAVKPPRG